MRIVVRDDGKPPQQAELRFSIVVLSADSPVNQPPSVPDRGIYRTYPEYPIAFDVGATDPDGDELEYRAEGLPEGASFDESTGTFTWFPASVQTGAYYVPVTVTDDGLPPQSSETTLVFRVSPAVDCNEPECDPASGCEDRLEGIDESCCRNSPTVRVPEPVAECPRCARPPRRSKHPRIRSSAEL